MARPRSRRSPAAPRPRARRASAPAPAAARAAGGRAAAAPREPGAAAPRGSGAAAAPRGPGDALLDEVVDRLAARFGDLIRFWGFGPHAGRVWAVLYLSPRPQPAAALAARLHMSAGLLSQTLTLLERWGVVRRFRAPGRKLLLHAGTEDVWSTVTRVLGTRELGMVRELVTDTAAAAASARRARSLGADAERAAHVERRVVALRRLARVGEGLLTVLLAAGTFDLGRLRGAMRLVGQAKGAMTS